MLLVLQLGTDGHYDLANVDPGHCALGFPKAPPIPFWSLDGDSMPVMNVHRKELPPRSLRATYTGNRLHALPQRLLFAAIAHQDILLVFEPNLFGTELSFWSLPETINETSSLSSSLFQGHTNLRIPRTSLSSPQELAHSRKVPRFGLYDPPMEAPCLH